jgi:hypothetical protein
VGRRIFPSAWLKRLKCSSSRAASCGLRPFWLSTSRLRSNFVAAEPPGRKIATNNFGIREMSVYMPRLEKVSPPAE